MKLDSSYEMFIGEMEQDRCRTYFDASSEYRLRRLIQTALPAAGREATVVGTGLPCKQVEWPVMEKLHINPVSGQHFYST